MAASTYWVIKVILQGIAAVFFLLGAVCGLMDSWQDKEHEHTRAWFSGKWIALSKSPWLSLPEKVIRWFLRLSKCPLNPLWVAMYGSPSFYKIPAVAGGVAVIAMLVLALLWGGTTGRAVAICVVVVMAIGVFIDLFAHTGRISERRYSMMDSIVLGVIIVAVIALLGIVTLFMPLYMAATISAVVMVPLAATASIALWSLLYSTTGRDHQISEDLTFVPCWAVPISFAITLLAMVVGHLADRTAWIPRTGWMLSSNLLFDSLTIVITVIILRWAVTRKALLRIPFGVVVDILIAAMFAFGSLYYGLVFTRKALTVQEVARVLIARSPDGTSWELGPYFWIMHTTFIPTLAYLSAVLICWVGKAMLIPARAFLGKGQEHSNPLKLTALLCGLMVALFMLASVPFGAVQDYREKLEKPSAKVKAAYLMPYKPSGKALPISLTVAKLCVRGQEGGSK